MRVGEVDLPAELVESHRSGQLVLFVGAGASRDDPSSLPDFGGLTKDIARQAQEPVDDADLKHPDVFLGRLADQEVNVHELVASVVRRPGSRPNHLHAALADLAVAGGPVRIVTTNYDLHLSTSLRERDAKFDEYVGPALPMGDDFTGVVYLHGNLEHHARHLIVTDADFGRAYLRDAWAARFLERMFGQFTVLFVGYSHGDVVMRYLGRSLGPGAMRYGLTSESDRTDWRPLDVHPIAYPVVGDSHAALGEAIQRWSRLVSMGMLGHRQRVAELLSAVPPQVPEDVSYLEAVLADPGRVRLFAEAARGEEWLAWASTQSEFQRLFDPAAQPTGCTRRLAWWFAEHYVVVEAHTRTALDVVGDAGGRLGHELWSVIAHQLHILGSPRPPWLGQWLVLLLNTMPEDETDWLAYALLSSRWPADQAVALLLFDTLTEPRVATKPPLGFPGAAHFDIRQRSTSVHLEEAWRGVFLPHLEEAAPAVLAIADRHLRRARQLLVAAGVAGPDWDSVSFSRSAIEPHPQDEYSDDFGVLIDSARDSLEALLDMGDPLGVRYLDAWADSGMPILRRLAVHGWTRRTDADGRTKIQWLRERGWLFDDQVHHEVFQLLASAVPTADTDIADGLVGDVLAGPPEAEEETECDDEDRAYVRFNMLSWITRHAPELQSARQARAELATIYPDFVERSHPDLLSWVEGGIVQSNPPMTVDTLVDLIRADPAAAVRELRRYENVSFPSDGPRWNDAVALLAQAVREHPSCGLDVFDAEGANHPDLVRGLISGWSTATVDDDLAERILSRLSGVDLRVLAGQLAQLLADGGRSESHPTQWYRFATARTLASALWRALDGRLPSPQIDDWLQHAISTPEGRLAQFWTTAIAADWRATEEAWTGLPPNARAELEAMLGTDDLRRAPAETVFASHVHFFFAADRGWCESHVLPLFDWSVPERARRAWHGFLHGGRWNDQLLSAGLLKAFHLTAQHLDAFPDTLQRRLLNYLAAVAATSQLGEADILEWAQKLTAAINPEHRAAWMKAVAWHLGRLPERAVEHQWHRWIHTYWEQRLRGASRELTTAEASAMATWVAYLTDSVPDGVALATTHDAALDEHGDILSALKGERLQRAPAGFGKLLRHLMRHTQPPFWGDHHLDEIVPVLRAGADPADVQAIVDDALRLGCAKATDW